VGTQHFRSILLVEPAKMSDYSFIFWESSLQKLLSVQAMPGVEHDAFDSSKPMF